MFGVSHYCHSLDQNEFVWLFRAEKSPTFAENHKDLGDMLKTSEDCGLGVGTYNFNYRFMMLLSFLDLNLCSHPLSPTVLIYLYCKEKRCSA